MRDGSVLYMLRDGPVSARDTGGVLRCANGPFFHRCHQPQKFSVGVIYGRETKMGCGAVKSRKSQQTSPVDYMFPTCWWRYLGVSCIKKTCKIKKTCAFIAGSRSDRRADTQVPSRQTTAPAARTTSGISYFPQSAYRDSDERRSCELQTTPMHLHGPEPPVVLFQLAGVSAHVH